MNFNKLNKTAKNRAIKDYIEGWEYTHDEDDLTIVEIIEILSESDDDFNTNGTLK